MTPEQTLDWLAQQHWDQCREDRPIQDWIRKMKSELPARPEQCKYGQEPKSCTSSPMDCQCAIDATLAQPEQEPVAKYSDIVSDGGLDPRNTTPPQRTWVGLDNDDLIWIYSNSDKVGQAISNTEAKLKEKNT